MIWDNKFLDNVSLPEFSNFRGKYFYPDTPSDCLDKKYFYSYPYEIFYSFNSMGYRDDEWPSDLKTPTWCIGDSGTTSIGTPVEHSWPYLLSNLTGIRSLNLSLKGASNFWIHRQAKKVIETVKPDTVVINWTFLHRREITDDEARHNYWNRIYSNIKKRNWPDCTSVLAYNSLPEDIKKEIEEVHKIDIFGKVPQAEKLSLMPCLDDNQNTDLIFSLITDIESIKSNTKVLHTFVPEYSNKQHREVFKNLFESRFKLDMIKINQVDTARDGRHWDVKTSFNFCERIYDYIK